METLIWRFILHIAPWWRESELWKPFYFVLIEAGSCSSQYRQKKCYCIQVPSLLVSTQGKMKKWFANIFKLKVGVKTMLTTMDILLYYILLHFDYTTMDRHALVTCAVLITERFISYRKYIQQITQPSQCRCTQLQYRFALISEAPSIPPSQSLPRIAQSRGLGDNRI